MSLRGLKPGDRVLCNVRGRTFEAHYVGLSENLPGRVRVDPVDSRITFHHIKKTEISRKA